MTDREDSKLIDLRRELLAWFDREQRDLPWRRTRDPYPVWVSEIMLQQTRVEVVGPYFERFLESFPSLEALASADVEEVLSRWSGLGYYQRARRLHAAARRIVEEGGLFPTSVEGWQRLPGVGKYTAAAITSIVVGLREPAIDGNVMRVVARLMALDEHPRKKLGSSAIEARARDLLDTERPGDSNQAIMEVGATICRPRKPKCPICPLEGGCLAAAAGEPEKYPVTGKRSLPERRRRQVAVVESQDRILLVRRPEDSARMAGFWELPWTDGACEGDSAGALEQSYGGRWKVGATRGRVRHSVTNRLFDIEVVEARLRSTDEVAEGPEVGWFSRSELGQLPVTGLVRKVLRLLDP